MSGRPLLMSLLIALVAIGTCAALFKDALIPYVFQLAMPTDYFEPERTKPDAFVMVAPGTFAFRHGFNRSLVIVAEDALAVIDPFNSEHARRLKLALEKRFPGKPVGWLFYSHHHLDHIRGGGELKARRVVAHSDVTSYVTDFPYADDIAPVTQTFSGDATVEIGSRRLELLFLPRSHSETLYAFYLPDVKVVFLPDLLFKDAVPPFGFPDWYYPGYIRALDRLLTLDADVHVPTHFDIGTRSDLTSYRDFMVDFRASVLEALAAHDYDAADGARLRKVLRQVYPKLARTHGHRKGFDAMFIPHFGGQAGGSYLGY